MIVWTLTFFYYYYTPHPAVAATCLMEANSENTRVFKISLQVEDPLVF